jgi:hypothetical protein
MQAEEQIQEIRTLAREFAGEELRPHVERWDHERAIDASTIAQLGELGFFGMLVPETHGGMDFDLPTFAAAIEELAWGEAAIAMLVAGNAVLSRLLIEQGTEAQRHEWLDRIVRGEVITTTAVAEEEAGSDVAAIQTTAMRSGAGWVVTGEKKWVSNAARGGVALVLARTSENSRGAFLVPLTAPGVSITERAETLGFRTIDISTVRFDGVQLGSDALLGAPDGGAAILAARADLARIAAAAVATGIARAALEHALNYADTREQFGSKLRTFEGIQFKLADMSARTAAARALLEDAAATATHERIAQAKLFAGETAMWVATEAVQIFGGYGYMRDYPVEKLMRDAKAMELIEGASELLRVEIAETLYAHE